MCETESVDALRDPHIVLAIGNRSFDVCPDCIERIVNNSGLPDGEFVNELVRQIDKARPGR